MEVMASSDNVLRAGLTSKHVSIGDLVEVGDFGPLNPAPVPSLNRGHGLRTLAPPAAEFELWVHTAAAGQPRDPRASSSHREARPFVGSADRPGVHWACGPADGRHQGPPGARQVRLPPATWSTWM